MIPEIPGFSFWWGWIYTALMIFVVIGIGRDRTGALTVVRTINAAAFIVWLHFAVFYVPYYGFPSWYPEASAGILLAIMFPSMILIKKFGDRADAAERKETSAP